MNSIKSQLMDMGFNETKVKRAIESCPEAKTLEQVMEWLIAHEDELNSEPAANPTPSTKDSDMKAVKEEKSPVTLASNSTDKADSQAGVADDSSTNTAARKKITVDEVQRIISERLAKRSEEERKKEIEDEKRRRLDGQKIAETRAELQDQERTRMAQQIRREKLEKEMHRKQVLEQIARDREAMKLKNGTSNPPTTSSTSSTMNASPSNTASSKPKSSVTECRIALRFPDGTSLVQKFSPLEQLAAVRLFVQMEKGGANEIEFIAPPNRKLTETMMDETLESLGLCPASRLEVKYKQSIVPDLD